MIVIEEIVQVLIFIFESIGVIVVVYGGLKAVYNFFKFEFFSKKTHREQSLEDLRVKFGQKILIALEFFVASDLIRLTISPTTEALIQLGGFVAIRTVLSYFLNREIREIKEKHWKKVAEVHKQNKAALQDQMNSIN